MMLTPEQQNFLETHDSAAMVTVAKNGVPKTARVSIAVVDGRLWSSGKQDRVRTARLRRDPRCTLFVFEAGWKWLTLETTVRILEGPEVNQMQVRLMRQMQNRPSGDISWFGQELSDDNFIIQMEKEHRLIYEFEIQHAYGMV